MEYSTSKHLDMVRTELNNAKKKHPHFVDAISFWSPLLIEKALEDARKYLDYASKRNQVEIEHVLMCEFREALEAVMNGDYEHARQEFAQCAAVCIRAMEECEKAVEKRRGTNENTIQK